MDSERSMRRLFFALWPDRALRIALANARQNLMSTSGGREIPPDKLHITLAFLGAVPAARLEQVVAIATEVSNEIPPEPVQVTLDVIEYWRKAKLLCATTAERSGLCAPGATPGAVLADTFEPRLTAAGFAPDLKPFRAHVTLARHVHHAPSCRKMQSVTGSFTEFVLVDSQTWPQGSVYTVLQRFPFCS